ncbi:MAG TPA: hypothetical protein VK812_06105 [Candidatus Binatus sp.]|jgi:hypothetical protein|nr:hypothetical protein [Candidatus Binatus sp.]
MLKTLTTATVYLVLAVTCGAQADEPKPSVSADPLTAEQVAIYRAALADFKTGRARTPQIANTTVPLRMMSVGRPHSTFVSCVDGIGTPSDQDQHQLVHRLDSSVVAGTDLPLVDFWEVPQMRHGPPDPKAPHLGLLTLSEIAFDRDHLRAIVTYDFNCGGLCGGGKMLALTKSGEEWKISKICVRWMY